MSDIYLLKLKFTDPDFSHIRYIRNKVFTDELGISKSKLFDKYDETSDHFIMFDGKHVVGSVRFILLGDTVKLERMAILQEYRIKNYGKNSILQLKEYYDMLGYTHMILDSIYSVSDFYKKCGFIEEDEVLQRVGIDHIRMSLTF